MTVLLEAGRFFLVGGTGTVIGLGVIYGFHAAGLSPVAANLAGYAITVPLAYIAHARLSFRRRQIRLRAFPKYILVVLLSYCGNFMILLALTKVFGVNGYLAQIPALMMYSAMFFLLNRLFVFQETPIFTKLDAGSGSDTH